MINLEIRFAGKHSKSNFSNIWCKAWSVTLHKHFEIQIVKYSPVILTLLLRHKTECDHAGWTVELGLFGYEIYFNLLENRHWDFENSTWENYDNK